MHIVLAISGAPEQGCRHHNSYRQICLLCKLVFVQERGKQRYKQRYKQYVHMYVCKYVALLFWALTIGA